MLLGCRRHLCLLLLIVGGSVRPEPRGKDRRERQGRVFSLFSVVAFTNSACQTTSATTSSTATFRNGTCMTSSECTSMSGSAQGNCASGFGVCCLFVNTAGTGTVSQNCTYLQNPGFPTAYTQTAGVSYTVSKTNSDVCFLRLDFETFTLVGPQSTTELNGGSCMAFDQFTTTLSTGGPAVPTICGQNTGLHMYLDLGAGASDTATLALSFTGASTTRVWEIKVTQVECASSAAPPNGCLQYSTSQAGRFTTFNFAPAASNHLVSQSYSFCVRPAMGMCCIRYSVCTDNLNSFTLDQGAIAGAMQDSACTQDFIAIEGGSGICAAGGNPPTVSRFCGNNLSLVAKNTMNDLICDCSAPFIVGVFTDTAADAGSAARPNRGICLDYQQLPC